MSFSTPDHPPTTGQKPCAAWSRCSRTCGNLPRTARFCTCSTSTDAVGCAADGWCGKAAGTTCGQPCAFCNVHACLGMSARGFSLACQQAELDYALRPHFARQCPSERWRVQSPIKTVSDPVSTASPALSQSADLIGQYRTRVLYGTSNLHMSRFTCRMYVTR